MRFFAYAGITEGQRCLRRLRRRPPPAARRRPPAAARRSLPAPRSRL